MLGQIGIRDQKYVYEWSPLEYFDGMGIKKIDTNFGQSFVLNENSKVIR